MANRITIRRRKSYYQQEMEILLVTVFIALPFGVALAWFLVYN